MVSYGCSMTKPPKRVREPVQVYLTTADKSLLDQLALQTSLPRAELLRRGIRRLASELNADAMPGRSLSSLVGSLEGSADVPADLAERHDEYLYQYPDAKRSRRD